MLEAFSSEALLAKIGGVARYLIRYLRGRDFR